MNVKLPYLCATTCPCQDCLNKNMQSSELYWHWHLPTTRLWPGPVAFDCETKFVVDAFLAIVRVDISL